MDGMVTLLLWVVCFTAHQWRRFDGGPKLLGEN